MAPVRLLRTADAPRTTYTACAASTRRTLPAEPARCAVLTAPGGAAGLPLVDARAACGMQAAGQFGNGGLVSISGDNNHVSVVASTLTSITVRAHRGVAAESPRTVAPVRLLRTADAPRSAAHVPHIEHSREPCGRADEMCRALACTA